jgi:hypothetical protein
MYSTCLFCNGALGTNEAIETFPVGRRLAFDAAKGRLWVVCRHCERWNLTPLEERWEAIEECERAFRGTRLRVSTEEIGMARLREGLELVRIGAPQRPEMAAWRYGDQFGRRRKRAVLIGGGLAVAAAGYVIAGPVMGLVTTVGLGGTGLLNLFNVGRSIYRTRAVAARIPIGGGNVAVVQRDQLDSAKLRWQPSDSRWSLDVKHRSIAHFDVTRRAVDLQRGESTFTGDEAIQAARQLLPGINATGAGRTAVAEAVDYLVESPEPSALFARAARSFGEKEKWSDRERKISLKTMPVAVRLALEMSAHEDAERRALEGELHLLASAWRDAEEIAGIADDMFLPPSIDETIARLRREQP